jgi:hypothetical protein
MTSRFLVLVGSLSLKEQKLWFPNQVVHDPDTWTSPNLLHLKREYDVLVNKHGCIVQEMYTVQDPVSQVPPSEFLLLLTLHGLYKTNVRNQEPPQPGDSRPVMPPSQRVLSRQMMRNWEIWNTNIQSLTITGCCDNWIFMHKKLSPLQVFKTLTLVLVLTMFTCPFCPLKWRLLNLTMSKFQLVNCFSVTFFILGYNR